MATPDVFFQAHVDSVQGVLVFDFDLVADASSGLQECPGHLNGPSGSCRVVEGSVAQGVPGVWVRTPPHQFAGHSHELGALSSALLCVIRSLVTITQLHSVDFSQMRIGASKRVFSTYGKSRIASFVFDSILGPPCQALHT